MKTGKPLTKTLFALALIIAAALLCSACGSYLSIDSGEGDGLAVTMEKAGKGSGGLGYLTLGEGQVMLVKADFSDRGAINIKVRPSDPNVDIDSLPDLDFKENVLVDVDFTGQSESEYELPAGDYDLLLTVARRGSGTLTVEAADK